MCMRTAKSVMPQSMRRFSLITLGSAPLAAVTIRRFLTDTYVNEDAERVLRYKVVYGLLVRDGQIEAVSADEMRRCHNTDAITGEPLTPEDGVMFGDLSEQVAAS